MSRVLVVFLALSLIALLAFSAMGEKEMQQLQEFIGSLSDRLLDKSSGPPENFTVVVPNFTKPPKQLPRQPGIGQLCNLTRWIPQINHPVLFENPRYVQTPVKVYLDIESGQKLLHFGNESLKAVEDSLLEWTEATNGSVSFITVDDEKSAQIVVHWFGYIQGNEYDYGFFGHSTPTAFTIDGLGNITILKNASVNLLALPAGTNYGRSVRNTVIHEFGHALGLAHSNMSKSAIMYPYGSAYQSIDTQAANTLKELYSISLPPACATRIGNILDNQ